MGAWSFIEPLIEESLGGCDMAPTRAKYAGRGAAASPATGQMSRHLKQQQDLIDQALTIKD
jgi:2-oxoglutarate dehydrogenase E1 component